MEPIKDKAGRRAPIRMRSQNCAPGESCGGCVKCRINADIARRAALPKDHPDYAIDDTDKTGTMGLRDTPELRKNATELTKKKK